jgi:hypothetical protein
MKLLERGIQRMRAAEFARKDRHAWELELAEIYLQEAKGIGAADGAIWETFRLQYNLVLSDSELLAFSNFLVDRYPDYPSWSEMDFIKDYTRLNETGLPLQRHVIKKPAPSMKRTPNLKGKAFRLTRAQLPAYFSKVE